MTLFELRNRNNLTQT